MFYFYENINETIVDNSILSGNRLHLNDFNFTPIESNSMLCLNNNLKLPTVTQTITDNTVNGNINISLKAKNI